MRSVILLPFIFLAASGTVMAQSALERVLAQIDGAMNLAPVNGTYANIAESVGTQSVTTSTTSTQTEVPLDFANAPDATLLWEIRPFGKETTTISATVADLGTTWTADDIVGLAGTGYESVTLNLDGSLTLTDTDGGSLPASLQVSNLSTGLDETLSEGTSSYELAADAHVYDIYGDGSLLALMTAAVADDEWGLSDTDLYLGDITTTTRTTIPGISVVIDGSIANVITGITATTAESLAGVTTAKAIIVPTFNSGNMATTTLGAVNTGEITLGVNSAVDEASTTTTRAISATMRQIGATADTGALVLNVASNASAVNGSIQNALTSVDGAIGTLSTTALGAVNTGTITSGVDTAVYGIVGMSGRSSEPRLP